MSDDRAVQVKAGTVNLKLTLNAKLLKKSFRDAVLTPFIKAYNKKSSTDWTADDLVSVTVDGSLMTDYGVAASVVLLSGSVVSAELQFRVVKTQPGSELPGPFSGEKWSAPSGGDVAFVQDEDDRSEIEKLKAQRREARLMREAATECSAAGGAAVRHKQPKPRTAVQRASRSW